MLRKEHEYETPIESNNYQNEHLNSDSQELKTIKIS